MPLRDTRDIIRDGLKTGHVEIVREAEKRSGIRMPTFRLPQTPTEFSGALGEVLSQRSRDVEVGPQPTINDVVSRIFSDLPQNVFTPTTEELMQGFGEQQGAGMPEPAIEPLGFAEQFPGLTTPETAGQFAAPSIGSQPLFAGGGAIFPSEIVNARKRAIEAAAFKAQQKKDKMKDLWNNIGPLETAEQFQSKLSFDFNDFINKSLFETADKYFNGNVSEAQAVLLDKGNTMGVNFQKKIEAFRSLATDIKGLDEEIDAMLQAYNDNEIELSKETFQLIQRYHSGKGNIDAWIEDPESFSDLRNKIQSAPSIEKSINEAMENFEADIDAWISERRDLDPKELGRAFQKYKKESFSKDRIRNEAKAIVESKHYDVTGIATVDDIAKRIENKIGDLESITETSFAKFIKPKEAYGAVGSQSGSEIFDDTFQSIQSSFFPEAKNALRDPKLDMFAKGDRIMRSFINSSGGEMSTTPIFDNTLTSKRQIPQELLNKIGDQEVLLSNAMIHQKTTKSGAVMINPGANAEQILAERKAEILAMEDGSEKRKKLQEEFDALKNAFEGTGVKAKIKSVQQQMVHQSPDGRLVALDKDYTAQNQFLINTAVPYAVIEYQVVKKGKDKFGDEVEINKGLPDTIYKYFDLRSNSAKSALGNMIYGASTERQTRKIGGDQPFEDAQIQEF